MDNFTVEAAGFHSEFLMPFYHIYRRVIPGQFRSNSQPDKPVLAKFIFYIYRRLRNSGLCFSKYLSALL